MIMRTEKNKNYTVMGNYHLRDKELSLKAKGLLSIMLSLPDKWDFSIDGLATLSADGVMATRAALRELEEHRYLERGQIKENGKIVDWEYVVYEKQFDEKDRKYPQKKKKSADSNPLVQNTLVENGRQLNTKETNTKEINTFSTSPSDAPIPAESVRKEKNLKSCKKANKTETSLYQPTSDSEENSAAGIVSQGHLVKKLTDVERAALLGKVYGMAYKSEIPFGLQDGMATLTMEEAFDYWLDLAAYRERAREAYLSKFLQAWKNILDYRSDRFWMPVWGGDGYVWQNVIKSYAHNWNPGTPDERREAKAKEIWDDAKEELHGKTTNGEIALD